MKTKADSERVHREASFRSVNFTSAIRALPDLMKEHKTKPCTKKDAPAEKHGTWRKVSMSSKTRIKLRFTLLLKPGQYRSPFQESPEEREFVVDSGASMRMLSKRF